MKPNKINKYTIVSILSMCGFFALWWLATDIFKLMPDYMLPSPITVLKTFIQKFYDPNPDGGTLIQHIITSLIVALSGYILGVAVGIPLGIAMAWFPKFERFFRPIFDLIRPVPTIAWIPLMILWFGIGLPSKTGLIFIATFVPCVINAYSGIKLTSPVHLWVAQTFGASRRELLFTVAIPTAIPLFFTGMRISLGVAWMSLVAAELLAATNGLGYMIQVNRMLGRADVIIVGMITIGAIGALLAFILEYIENKYVKGGPASNE